MQSLLSKTRLIPTSFGFEYFDAAQRKSIAEKNQQVRLQLNEALLSSSDADTSIELIADLDKKKAILQHASFRSEDKEFLGRFPQYSSVWQWEERMKVGYAYSCELPDFDPVANEELGNILKDIKL